MKKTGLIFTALFALPMVVSAQELIPLFNFLDSVTMLTRVAVPLLITLGLLAFFWGLVQYIFKGAKGAAEGKNVMLWALVALFVMVSVWGIITMAQNALGVQGSNVPTVPAVPGIRYNR